MRSSRSVWAEAVNKTSIDLLDSGQKLCAEYKNRHLLQGRYASAGFPGDRSRAETALIEELGWWFEDDEEIVWTIMDWICRLNPQTDKSEQRKWLERDNDWRQTLFDNDWFGNRRTYNPWMLQEPGDERRQVSRPTKVFVLDAIREMGCATSKEIESHPDVDRGRRQVLRALNELEAAGVIDWEREGNLVYYYPAGREDLLPEGVGN